MSPYGYYFKHNFLDGISCQQPCWCVPFPLLSCCHHHRHPKNGGSTATFALYMGAYIWRKLLGVPWVPAKAAACKAYRFTNRRNHRFSIPFSAHLRCSMMTEYRKWSVNSSWFLSLYLTYIITECIAICDVRSLCRSYINISWVRSSGRSNGESSSYRKTVSCAISFTTTTLSIASFWQHKSFYRGRVHKL